VQYQFQEVRLNPIIARIVDSLQATVAEQGASIEIKDLPCVWGDPTALEQVFANLLGNALKYLDPGRPGRIEVGYCDEAADADHHGRAHAELEVHGARCSRTFYVQDNGRGIPTAYHGKLFQAFQRFHPDVAQGEGMGLALVRRMVERHRGNIWVESAEGVGSTFFVSLPRKV
jgi:signal transduction histidine kinase